MRLYGVSFTEAGSVIQKKLINAYASSGIDFHGFAKYPQKGLNPLETDIKTFAEEAFAKADGVIFIGSAGIAVRACAPFIKSKDRDPAVITADDTGRYVIPLLSGHLGGANKLALEIAGIIGAEAVITTSTDRNGVFAVDSWAADNFLYPVDIGMIKKVSSALLKGQTVGFSCDYDVAGDLPAGLLYGENFSVGISVSEDPSKRPFKDTLRLSPKDWIIGVGCRKNIDPEVFETLLKDFLKINDIPEERVRLIASIDLKKGETALIEAARKRRIGFITFTSKELSSIEGNFSASSFVKSVTGADNVCERAACLASGNFPIVKKYSMNGATFAASRIGFVCRF